jgi:NAD+ kinase
VNRIALVVHPRRDAAVAAAASLVGWARQHDIATVTVEPEARIRADDVIDPSRPDGLDLVVAVGGDGTFLRGAHLAALAGSPVLGVKVGRMGFLTEFEPEECTQVLEDILAGRVAIEQRLALEAEPEHAPWTEPQWALNEFIVEKSTRHRVVTVALFVGGDYVATISGDGLIVATPTGSTAYSFSARGPIVSPSVEGVVVTPIAAHMVFDRSFVLGPEEAVVLEVQGDEPGLLSGDGRESEELPVGSRVRIAPSDRPARVIRRAGASSFYRLIREKFDLPGNPLGDDPGGDVVPTQ